ncbi:MAG: hypothetical protein C4341_04030 [Armatimonadota bacterium]
MVCYRHPNEETTLRCSKCDRPICVRCAVLTTVGYRCPECGRESSAVRTVPAPQLALGAIVGAAGGFIVARFVPLFFPLLTLLFAPVAGGAVAAIAMVAMGKRASALVGALAAAGFLFGSVWSAVAAGAANVGAQGATSALGAIDVWRLAFAAIAGGVAWYRLA